MTFSTISSSTVLFLSLVTFSLSVSIDKKPSSSVKVGSMFLSTGLTIGPLGLTLVHCSSVKLKTTTVEDLFNNLIVPV